MSMTEALKSPTSCADAAPRIHMRGAVPDDAVALVNLQTFGCQMNEYDSELVGSLLHGRGYGFTGDDSRADVILFNTCAIRETAHTRIYARLGDLQHEKRQGPNWSSAFSDAWRRT